MPPCRVREHFIRAPSFTAKTQRVEYGPPNLSVRVAPCGICLFFRRRLLRRPWPRWPVPPGFNSGSGPSGRVRGVPPPPALGGVPVAGRAGGPGPGEPEPFGHPANDRKGKAWISTRPNLSKMFLNRIKRLIDCVFFKSISHYRLKAVRLPSDAFFLSTTLIFLFSLGCRGAPRGPPPSAPGRAFVIRRRLSPGALVWQRAAPSYLLFLLKRCRRIKPRASNKLSLK